MPLAPAVCYRLAAPPSCTTSEWQRLLHIVTVPVCYCLAAGRTTSEWQRLLHIVIVGGGPTGVEVAGELTDFIAQDLRRVYPDRARAMKYEQTLQH